MPREGVIVILEDSARRLLMQLRTGPNYGGSWGLFGGWIEPGETRDDAALREIHEELCLTLDPARLTYLCAYSVPKIDAIAHLYHYPLADGELAHAVLGEGADFRLMDRAEIQAASLAWFYRAYLDWYWAREES